MRYLLIVFLVVGCKHNIQQRNQTDESSKTESSDQSGKTTSESVQTKTDQGPSSTSSIRDEYYPVEPLPPDAGITTPRPEHGSLKSHEVTTTSTGPVVTLQDLQRQQEDYGLKMEKVDTSKKTDQSGSSQFGPSSGCGVGLGFWGAIILLAAIAIGYFYLKGRLKL